MAILGKDKAHDDKVYGLWSSAAMERGVAMHPSYKRQFLRDSILKMQLAGGDVENPKFFKGVNGKLRVSCPKTEAV